MATSSHNYLYDLSIELMFVGDPQYLTDHHNREGECLIYIDLPYSDVDEQSLIDEIVSNSFDLPSDILDSEVKNACNGILTDALKQEIKDLNEYEDADDIQVVFLATYSKTGWAYESHSFHESDLSYLINGDCSGMSDADITAVDEYLDSCQYEGISIGHWSVVDEESSLNPSPDYGEAGTTVEVLWVYKITD